MSKTEYYPLEEVNELQRNIMRFINHWVRTINQPVPRKEVLKEFMGKKVPKTTIEGAINSLLKKGFIRLGYTGSNKTSYVLLRTNYEN